MGLSLFGAAMLVVFGASVYIIYAAKKLFALHKSVDDLDYAYLRGMEDGRALFFECVQVCDMHGADAAQLRDALGAQPFCAEAALGAARDVIRELSQKIGEPLYGSDIVDSADDWAHEADLLAQLDMFEAWLGVGAQEAAAARQQWERYAGKLLPGALARALGIGGLDGDGVRLRGA